MRKGKTTLRARDTGTGAFVPAREARLSHGNVVTVRFVPQKGSAITVNRDARSGRFTTERSANRIRSTSIRASDSLKRLAKR